MTRETPCLLYSQDPDLVRRITAFLRFAVAIDHMADPTALRHTLGQTDSVVLLFDVRGTDAEQLMPEVRQNWPHALVIAFGHPRSDPFRQAQEIGVYAAENIDFDGRNLQFLVERAMEHLYLSESVRLLRDSLAASKAVAQHATALADRAGAAPSIRNIFPPLRHADNVETLLQGIIDGIARAAFVLRAGVFLRIPGEKTYRMKAGMGCRNTMHELAYAPEAAFVEWLDRTAQLASREGLRHAAGTDERIMLSHALDAMGAELIAPLHGRQSLIGWVFFGRKATGAAFEQADYQDVMVFAEHAAMAIENALLYREVALQKTFAETLLQSMPTGIVAAGEDGRVRWFNPAAERILRRERDATLGESVDVLGGKFGDTMRRALQGERGSQQPFEWRHVHTNAYLSARVLRLMNEDDCLGIVALVQDRTRERDLAERQRHLERAGFWTDLAAGMSHEIRNPLVAIKTFAQLLPERYGEPEFRSRFSAVVTQEVDRLNRIIEQVNAFANLPEPSLEQVDITSILKNAVERAKTAADAGAVSFDTELPPDPPALEADARALTDAFTHILVNAVEALRERETPTIRIGMTYTPPGAENGARLQIRFQDNGPGIPQEIRDKVFSPFCTTKISGMGLGLPIAQRVVMDHNGRIQIATGPEGTTVTVELPAATPGDTTP